MPALYEKIRDAYSKKGVGYNRAQTGKIVATDDVKAATISLKYHGHFALDNVTPLAGKPKP